MSSHVEDEYSCRDAPIQPTPRTCSPVFDEANVARPFTEALTADVHAVFSDETTLVAAHTAATKNKNRREKRMKRSERDRVHRLKKDMRSSMYRSSGNQTQPFIESRVDGEKLLGQRSK